MLDPKYTKPVSAFIAVQKEIPSTVVLTGSSLEYSLCVRTGTTSSYGNYFVSFNLPTQSSDLPLTGKTSLLYPELQQLNSEKIIIAQLPYTAYTEYIDGRSIELTIPIFYNSASTTYKLFSSTYSSDKSLMYGESSVLLGDNIAFLFSDNINSPYTGFTVNEIGQLISHSAATTWNTGINLNDRPSAVSYREIQGDVDAINTDRRLLRNQNISTSGGYPSYIGHFTDFVETDFFAGYLGLYAKPGHGFKTGDTVTVDKDNELINPTHNGITTIIDITYNASLPGYLSSYGQLDVITLNKSFESSSYLESGAVFFGSGAYYNYDTPVGFVVLDKGFVVLTHKKIVNNFSWNNGIVRSGATYASTTDDSKVNIHFNTGSTYSLKFTDLNTDFKTSAVCMALNGEFYISNNRTWDRTVALSQFGSFSPVYITEVGLYNALNELVAVSKFSEPVLRYVNDIFTFNIDIEM